MKRVVVLKFSLSCCENMFAGKNTRRKQRKMIHLEFGLVGSKLGLWMNPSRSSSNRGCLKRHSHPALLQLSADHKKLTLTVLSKQAGCT